MSEGVADVKDILSRRSFLKGSITATAAAGVAVAPHATSAVASTETAETVVEGDVVAVNGAVVKVRAVTGEVIVDTSAATEISRNGAASLSSFEVADEVCASGDWDGDVFRATLFSLMYRFMEGTVTARTKSRLDTTAGRMILTSGTRRDDAPGMQAKEPAELQPDDYVAATGWIHPRSKEFLVLRIGARA